MNNSIDKKDEGLTHDTMVFAAKEGEVIFFQSFHYATQKLAAQAALTYAQSLSGTWYIAHLGSRWNLVTEDCDEKYKFNIPLPITN